MFTTIYADPTWSFSDQLTMSPTPRGTEANYERSMSIEEICNLYQPSITHKVGREIRCELPTLAGHPIGPDGFLWLWAPATHVLSGDAVRVCNAWGYRATQIVPWIKGRVGKIPPRDGCHDLPDYGLIIQPGMGHVTSCVVEYLIVAVRGKYKSLVKQKMVKGLIVSEEDALLLAPRRKSPGRESKHSTKPIEAYELIEKICPGPYLELFACEHREGWASWGNQLPTLHTETSREYQLPPLDNQLVVDSPLDAPQGIPEAIGTSEEFPLTARSEYLGITRADDEKIEWP